MWLSDNTVLIMSGATGIGYTMAEAFLEAGSRSSSAPPTLAASALLTNEVTR
jgi:NAD(P)-dependent dehydrogenase (short-subunit alcohol dehydrogenase family)